MAKAKDLQKLRQAYSHALLLASRRWRRLADGVAKKHGLSDATALPLVVMSRLGDGLSQTALAEAVGIEGPSLVRLLDQLSAASLIVRQEDAADRRAKILTLTPAGRSLAAKLEIDLAKLRDHVFASVSAADLEAALRVLASIQHYGSLHDAGAGRRRP